MLQPRLEEPSDFATDPSWWFADLQRAAELAGRLDRQIDGWLSGYELPQPVIRILIALFESPGTPQRLIGNHIGMSAPQLSRNVKELVADGLIAVDPSSSERLRVLHLTYKGEQQARELVAARKAAFGAAIEAVTPEDRPLVLSMARFQKVAGSESEPVRMDPLTPKDAVIMFNHVLASLPAKLKWQPLFLKYATGLLSTAVANWPALNDDAGVVVREAEGTIVGACGIIREGSSNIGILVGPFVDPIHRRQRIGARALAECLRICRRVGIERLEARVPASSSNIASFLRSNDFRVEHRLDSGKDLATATGWVSLSSFVE
jgi:DNA-binding MarR family transcriptional regulator/GNAT superfamily N-acetyltransferase